MYSLFNDIDFRRKRSREYTKKHRLFKRLLIDDKISESFCETERKKSKEYICDSNILDKSVSDECSSNDDLNFLDEISSDETNEKNDLISADFYSSSSDSEKCEEICSDNDSSHSRSPECNEDFLFENEEKSLKERLQIWALENITNLKNKAISEILTVLQDEGFKDLPKTAESLLKTKHFRVTREMTTSKGTTGVYSYCGIKEEFLKLPIIL